jgi:hypothetical protein
VDADKTKYMVMFRDQTAGRSDGMKTDNSSFERVEEFKYLETTLKNQNPGGGEIFRTRPDRPWDPPSLLYNGHRVFPGGKAAGAWC